MFISSLPLEVLLRKSKSLRRDLREKRHSLELRIAILSGSTTNEAADFLELLLLNDGIKPILHMGEYNRYFEESALDSSALSNFRPQIVYIHTSSVNIQRVLPLEASEPDFAACVSAEAMRFAAIWNALERQVSCLIIQNNFELPFARLLGNQDCVSPAGKTHFINALNAEFAREAGLRPKLLINDLNHIAATVGLGHFHDEKRWWSYKLISTPAGSLAIAQSLAAIVRSVYGYSRKCLVLDLDNTLWGGVIGDDGPDKIIIGKETAEAEAYTAFQQYCLQLRNRGILLAVCSKNSEEIAQQGFAHPDSVLRIHHFACFKANWEPKHENIKAIAAELNIGLDSLVFADDNPAERAIVSAQLPMVAVPDIGSDVSQFVRRLDQYRYFETLTLSAEDLARSRQYESNVQRSNAQASFANYDEYLEYLEMTAEIAPFRPVYMERIVQLINKTNQFNLTTSRYTLAEVETLARAPDSVTLYGRLADRFGDNGLISVIIGRQKGEVLHLDLWLMSCRVLKRDMEVAMLDSLTFACKHRGIREIRGYYIRSPKNIMVADHYARLGFERVAGTPDERSVWRLSLVGGYTPKNKHIVVKELVYG